MSRSVKAPLLLSPNSVLANALLRSIDLLRPRVLATRPARIEFVVGTQINGAPHLGTNLVQSAAFLLAKTARREFSIDTTVRFGALDNAPHDVVLDPETHTACQQTYFHALGKNRVAELIETYYRRSSTPSRRPPTPTTRWRPTPINKPPRGFGPSFCAPSNGWRTSDGGWLLHTASCTFASRVQSAGGRRNALTAPSSLTSTKTVPRSPRYVLITVPTTRTSTPKTAGRTSTWPRCTGTW
ncbi:hypothetical protein H4W32_003503 [Actinophytocola algeriensis]|uniref:Uncharacterized protein n=1 Tax=Actinophytocola algeriensis TaxID=1768010 RepID=A0A7W7Q9D9_9PSEU|nr:hypothetical protein [Actinophytocola algeriensis]MBE1475461.1 hypothetical protein [Actinophytocola algeriensis]